MYTHSAILFNVHRQPYTVCLSHRHRPALEGILTQKNLHHTRHLPRLFGNWINSFDDEIIWKTKLSYAMHLPNVPRATTGFLMLWYFYELVKLHTCIINFHEAYNNLESWTFCELCYHIVHYVCLMLFSWHRPYQPTLFWTLISTSQIF